MDTCRIQKIENCVFTLHAQFVKLPLMSAATNCTAIPAQMFLFPLYNDVKMATQYLYVAEELKFEINLTETDAYLDTIAPPYSASVLKTFSHLKSSPLKVDFISN